MVFASDDRSGIGWSPCEAARVVYSADMNARSIVIGVNEKCELLADHNPEWFPEGGPFLPCACQFGGGILG